MNNNAKTLRTIALILFIIGILCSSIYCFFLIIYKQVFLGILCLIIGILASCLEKFFIDCFANLIERVECIDNKISQISTNIDKPKEVFEYKKESKKINKTCTLDKIKDEIKHLNKFEKQYIIERNTDLYKKVKKATTDSLYKIVEEMNESQECIYLCCFEILDRLENKQ